MVQARSEELNRFGMAEPEHHPLQLDLSVWGDPSRRHASLKTDGSTLVKVSHDFQPSSAISRIAGFHTFYAEVLVTKAMRGTAVGVALNSIELDQPWFVPAILKRWQNSRQKELDKARVDQEKQRKETKLQIASGMAALSREERAAKEFSMKEAQLHADNVVLQAGQELREAQQAVLAIEAKLRDSFGPRVWFFTCEGLFYAGEKLVATTGVTFGDGDRVKIELLGHELSVYINDKKVPGVSAAVCTRVFFAVCLQNKGAQVQIIHSSQSEVDELRNAKGIEDETEEDHEEVEVVAMSRPATRISRTEPARPDDVLASVAILAEVLMEKWAIVDQAFRALDANGDGMISPYEFKSVMSQFGITETELGRPVDDVWAFLDSDKSGQMSHSEFLERVSFARESSDQAGTWGRHHEDITVDGNIITNTSCRGRAALLSRSATKGKHTVELKIVHMAGTLFVGAMQATRRVYIRAQKTVTEVTTLPLDHNWYYGPPTHEGEKITSQVWYLSDVGTLRHGSKSVAHADMELKTGDSLRMDLDMDKGQLTFTVNGLQLRETISHVSGEVFPAVFVAGDAGDSIALVNFSSDRPAG